MNKIMVDTKDYLSLINLMDRANEFKYPLFAKNESGENQLISINNDNITIETFQNNGITRQNVYHRDYTKEELFVR